MDFKKIYKMQINNQSLLIDNHLYDGVDNISLPTDNVFLSSYHIQQLMSEIGEVLAADKRWKNIRNDKYDYNNKLEEIADCFIVAMNIAMFSGISPNELEHEIINKLEIVNKRFKEKIS